ncbi:MAG: class I SAM-dependent methyltransferase family protein [Candidatus Bathyarchaeota archaeon]|nr:class I SAM-dependent methyltransferase family protein [Candidatus Bathyarchaeota archaeon]
MSKNAFCLQVPKKDGERTLKIANKLGLTDKTLLIQKGKDDLLYIPLIRQLEEKELTLLTTHVPQLKLGAKSFLKKNKQPQTLADVLKNELEPTLLGALPRAIDVVGDIAIIEIPPRLEAYKHLVGNAILKTHKNIRTVLAKAGAVKGTYRLREFEFIVGEQKTKTLHKENGCSYFVDVAKAYFSPRLSSEHNRVASLVQSGENIVDLFAGVGPFVVLIAKKHPDVKVYGVDINADAIDLLKKNARLNRVENRVYAVAGDARQVVNEKLEGVADRVIMNLPETAVEFIDTACKALKSSGGVVHFYGFVRLNESIENLKQRFVAAVEKSGRQVKIFSYIKPVRETAPREYQVVLDTKIL